MRTPRRRLATGVIMGRSGLTRGKRMSGKPPPATYRALEAASGSAVSGFLMIRRGRHGALAAFGHELVELGLILGEA